MRGGGSATRGDATNNRGKQEGGETIGNTTTRLHVERRLRIKRLRHNEKPCKKQPGEWEVTAHCEVLTHQEIERRRNCRQQDNQSG